MATALAPLDVYQAYAEKRLRRPLTDAERHVDLAGLDRDLEQGKARLAEAIELEKRRVIRETLRTGYRPQLQASQQIIDALAALYRAGRAHARAELTSMGITPEREFADPPPLDWTQWAALDQGLLNIGLRINNEIVDADITEAARSELLRALDRKVPGALDLASRLTSGALYAGAGDVFEQNEHLIENGWEYSAIMDAKTCAVCRAMDGRRYDTWAEAMGEMPNGGPNPRCYGDGRCRCRILPRPPDDAPDPEDDISVSGEPPVPPETIAVIRELRLDGWPPVKGPGARSVLGDAHDTRFIHKTGIVGGDGETGTWKPERRQLHREIVNEHFVGKEVPTGRKPRAFATSGGGASGKSRLNFRVGSQEVGLDDLGRHKTVVRIDPDEIKRKLPEYKRLVDLGDPFAANAVHEESSEIAKSITKIAQDRGYDVLLDTTGSGSNGKFLDKLKALADDGYDVQVSMISIPTNTAIERAVGRGLRSGRHVFTHPLKEAHAGASRAHLEWRDADFIKDWRVYDNSGTQAKLVAVKRAGTQRIIDRNAYDSILRKADQGTRAKTPLFQAGEHVKTGEFEGWPAALRGKRGTVLGVEPDGLVRVKLANGKTIKTTPEGITRPPAPKIRPVREGARTGSEATKAIHQETRDWAEKLTDAQRDAFEHYSGPGAYKINRGLRKIEKYKLGAAEKTSIRQLDGAMEKLALADDTVVYRGTDAVRDLFPDDFDFDPKAADVRALVGRTITDAGYLSTSTSRTQALRFADQALVEINLPKGQRGAWIRRALRKPDKINQVEQELLLPRGMSFVVRSVERKGGRWVFRLDVVE